MESTEIIDVEDDPTFADDNDEEKLDEMNHWLVNHAEILPSLAKKYCTQFVDAGIATIKRLAKKVLKDPEFLTSLNIGEDDRDEILSVLRRLISLFLNSCFFCNFLKQNSCMFYREGLFNAIAAEKEREQENAGILAVSMEPVSIMDDATETEGGFIVEKTPMKGFQNSEIIDNVETIIPMNFDQNVVLRRTNAANKIRIIERSAKFKELWQEACGLVDNLQVAVEAKMEAAALGILNTVLTFLDNSIERQRACFRANACPVLTACLRELGGSTSVCDRTLQVVSLLMRSNDENKSSICYDSAWSFGQCGLAEVLMAALTCHVDDHRIVESSMDAIRCLCCLPSNRLRLVHSGACESVGRCFTQYGSSVDLCCWIARVVGHLAKDSEEACDRFGQVGACESIVSILQRHQTHPSLCTEVCWALYQLSKPMPPNRDRMANEFAPETLSAVFKLHAHIEEFAVEACRALRWMISSEEDDLIARIARAGIMPSIFKALKKCPESESLSQYAFELIYYLSCDASNIPKLLAYDVLNALVVNLDRHSGLESMAEWGLRTVTKLAFYEDTRIKMRSAGLCETVVTTVQRQAISPSVSCHGTLAIGSLATEPTNESRLTTAGACEACVGALRRHESDIAVVINSCFAMHFLAASANNISWMGVNGACEALTSALKQHQADYAAVASSGIRALASLAYQDEGNLRRFHAAGACPVVVDCLKTHGDVPEVAQESCRAIYNLGGDNSNVSELGSRGSCGLVVTVLTTHANLPSVLTQACLAVSSLAVKAKSDRVHNGNTRKLVSRGVIEVLVAISQRFPFEAALQAASCLAWSSLGRLDTNRAACGSAGACEVVVSAFFTHFTSENVVEAAAKAIDILSQNSEENRQRLANPGRMTAAATSQQQQQQPVLAGGSNTVNNASNDTIAKLLEALERHERFPAVVVALFRALIAMLAHESSKIKIRSETSLKTIVKAMKFHEKDPSVASWGCHLLYVASSDDSTRSRLGGLKALEVVISLLARHGPSQRQVAIYGCKAMVALAMLSSNQLRFANSSEACTAVVRTLAAFSAGGISSASGHNSSHQSLKDDEHSDKKGSGKENGHENSEAEVAEWATAAIVALASQEVARPRLGAAKVGPALLSTLQMHRHNETVVRLACEAIHELSQDAGNRHLFGILGLPEEVVVVLQVHLSHAPAALQICRALAALAHDNIDNANQILGLKKEGDENVGVNKKTKGDTVSDENGDLSRVSVTDCLLRGFQLHSFHDGFVEWACHALAALAEGGLAESVYLYPYFLQSASDINPSHSKGSGAQSSSSSSSSTSATSSSVSSEEEDTDMSFSGLAGAGGGSLAFSLSPLSTAMSFPPESRGNGEGGGGVMSPGRRIIKVLGDVGLCESLAKALDIHRHNELVVRAALLAALHLASPEPTSRNRIRLSLLNLGPLLLSILRTHLGDEFIAMRCGWLLANVPLGRSTGDAGLHQSNNGVSSGNNSENTKDMESSSSSSSNNYDGPVSVSMKLFPSDTTASTSTASSNATSSSSYFTLYQSEAAWDLLAAALKMHEARNDTCRVLCQAVATFAQEGQLSHVPLCDAMWNVVSRYATSQATLSSSSSTSSTSFASSGSSASNSLTPSNISRSIATYLMSFSSLAACQGSNAARFGKIGAVEQVVYTLKRHLEAASATFTTVENVEMVYGACFQALWSLFSLKDDSGMNEGMSSSVSNIYSPRMLTIHVLSEFPPENSASTSSNSPAGTSASSTASNMITNAKGDWVIPTKVVIYPKNVEVENLVRYLEMGSQGYKAILKAFYNELEDPFVAFHGARLLSILCRGCREQQKKFGSVCTFMVDVFSLHRQRPPILSATLEAISRLSHGNMTNRNRFGASGICEELTKRLADFLALDSTRILWSVRCLADLAANSPQNQSKLGAAGACEILMGIFRRQLDLLTQFRSSHSSSSSFSSSDDIGGVNPISSKRRYSHATNTLMTTLDEQPVSSSMTGVGGTPSTKATRKSSLTRGSLMVGGSKNGSLENSRNESQRIELIRGLKWTLWAIGNLIQIGKGAFQDLSSTTTTTTSSSTTSSSSFFNTSGASLVDFSTSNVGGGRHGEGDVELSSSLSSSSSSSSSSSMMRNSLRFFNSGIVDLLRNLLSTLPETLTVEMSTTTTTTMSSSVPVWAQLLGTTSDWAELATWTLRLLCNLSKSKTLRQRMLEAQLIPSIRPLRDIAQSLQPNANSNSSSSNSSSNNSNDVMSGNGSGSGRLRTVSSNDFMDEINGGTAATASSLSIFPAVVGGVNPTSTTSTVYFLEWATLAMECLDREASNNGDAEKRARQVATSKGAGATGSTSLALFASAASVATSPPSMTLRRSSSYNTVRMRREKSMSVLYYLSHMYMYIYIDIY